MKTRRSVRQYCAHAISFIMIWAVSVIPSAKVEAQSVYEPHHFWASPSVTEVGSYIFFRGADLPPNKTYWLKYAKNGIPTPGMCPTETITTDANGEWVKLVGPLMPSEVGTWEVALQEQSWCGSGIFDFMEYRVSAVPEQLTVDKPIIAPGEYLTYAISGAAPNMLIKWSQWTNGLLIEDDQAYGEYTDANGNFTKTVGPFLPEYAARYIKRAHIYDQETGNHFIANVGFQALAQPLFTYTISPLVVPVNGVSVNQITGAPPNKLVKVERWRNGVFWDKFDVGYTDAAGAFNWNNGYWWSQDWKGLWHYKMTIDDVSVTKQFVVWDLNVPIPPDVVYSYTPITLDPGTGNYFSDIQIHMGGVEPNLDLILDASSRAWFDDPGGSQILPSEIPDLKLFSGFTTSGAVCSQVAQVPPTHPDCFVCGAGLLKICRLKYIGYGVAAVFGGAGIALACDGILSATGVGLAVLAACQMFAWIATFATIIALYAELKECICTIPGKCSDNVSQNCSKMYSGSVRAKKVCAGIIP